MENEWRAKESDRAKLQFNDDEVSIVNIFN